MLCVINLNLEIHICPFNVTIPISFSLFYTLSYCSSLSFSPLVYPRLLFRSRLLFSRREYSGVRGKISPKPGMALAFPDRFPRTVKLVSLTRLPLLSNRMAVTKVMTCIEFANSHHYKVPITFFF